MYYLELFSALNQAKVRYLVAGGVAVNLHGLPRATPDIDLVIDLSEKNIEAFWQTITLLDYTPRVPVTKNDFILPQYREKIATEKNAIVLSFYNKTYNFQVIDVFVKEPFNFEEIYLSAKIVTADNMRIPVVPIDLLIEMKYSAGREKDLADCRGLEKIKDLQHE